MWLRKKDFEILMEQIDEKLLPLKDDIQKLKYPPKFKYGDVVDVKDRSDFFWNRHRTYKKVRIIGLEWSKGHSFEPRGWAYAIDTGSGCVSEVNEVFINLSE